MDIDLLPRIHPDPSVGDAATRKRKDVWAARIYDGEFNVTVERCGGYRLPHA